MEDINYVVIVIGRFLNDVMTQSIINSFQLMIIYKITPYSKQNQPIPKDRQSKKMLGFHDESDTHPALPARTQWLKPPPKEQFSSLDSHSCFGYGEKISWPRFASGLSLLFYTVTLNIYVSQKLLLWGPLQYLFMFVICMVGWLMGWCSSTKISWASMPTTCVLLGFATICRVYLDLEVI